MCLYSSLKSVYMIKIVLKNHKERKYVNQRHFFYIKSGLEMEFTACYGEVMPEGALISFTVCNAHGYFEGYDVTKQVTHRIFNTNR